MDWKTCKEKRLAKEIGVDTELIKSLKISAGKKTSSAKLLEMNETTASSIITLAYDALRELLEAIAIKNGYKIYNHECYTSFLQSVMDENEMAESFDSLRKLRNSINYYGKDISIDDAKIVAEDIEELMKKCRPLLAED
ncbi:hypothetical protein CMO93_02545 [Candidatus Woesearchaeota archaeon]|nr:hypothetical protein [Candidatus Woesearchaeota archaeon]|tara:strand:+ start:3581 stop:3997 length:417 start_codon:yes stop_codon:yes gene_type:complete